MKGIIKKYLFPLSSVALVLCAICTGTSAFLHAESGRAENTFNSAVITSVITEEFDGEVKQNVCVKNTGTTGAFVRCGVTALWKNDTDGSVLSEVPVENTDYIIAYGDKGWTRAQDGFWYYEKPVAEGESTDALIKECTLVKSSRPDGYSLSLEILSSCIQAYPYSLAEEAWGVTVSDGKITARGG